MYWNSVAISMVFGVVDYHECLFANDKFYSVSLTAQIKWEYANDRHWIHHLIAKNGTFNAIPSSSLIKTDVGKTFRWIQKYNVAPPYPETQLPKISHCVLWITAFFGSYFCWTELTVGLCHWIWIREKRNNILFCLKWRETAMSDFDLGNFIHFIWKTFMWWQNYLNYSFFWVLFYLQFCLFSKL